MATFNSSGVYLASVTATIPATTQYQMCIVEQRANSATPPSLLSGFTNILTGVLVPEARSFRLSYRYGTASSITPSSGDGLAYAIVDDAIGIGASSKNESKTVSNTPPIPALNINVTDGTSCIIGGSYNNSNFTAVASPYSFDADTSGGIAYINGRTTNVPETDFTSGTSIYHLGFAVEVLGKTIEMAANGGTYSLTGTATTFSINYSLQLDSGTYSLTGTDADLVSNSYALTVDPGSYSFSGTTIDFSRNYNFDLDSGVYTLNGTDADLTLLVDYQFNLDSGSYNLTGFGIDFSSTDTPARVAPRVSKSRVELRLSSSNFEARRSKSSKKRMF